MGQTPYPISHVGLRVGINISHLKGWGWGEGKKNTKLATDGFEPLQQTYICLRGRRLNPSATQSCVLAMTATICKTGGAGATGGNLLLTWDADKPLPISAPISVYTFFSHGNDYGVGFEQPFVFYLFVTVPIVNIYSLPSPLALGRRVVQNPLCATVLHLEILEHHEGGVDLIQLSPDEELWS